MNNEKKFKEYLDAIQKDDLNLTKNLFCKEFLNKFDKNEFNGLLYASNLGHLEIARFLLDQQANIELPCPYNEWRALHWAVGNGYEKVGELLLDRGAQIESRTSKGMHPLHCAAIADHVDAVRVLLARGASLDSRTNNEETALQMALGNEADKTVALFKRWTEYSKIFTLVRQQDQEAVRAAFLRERLLVRETQTGLTVLDVAVDARAHACLELLFLERLDEHDVIEALSVTLGRLNVHRDQFRPQLRLYQSILFGNKAAFDENATVELANKAWLLTGESWLELCCRHRRAAFADPLMQMTLEADQAWQRALLCADQTCQDIADKIRSRQEFLRNRTRASYNRLHIAVQDNNVAVVRYILDNDLVNPDDNNAALGTPLCLAVSLGYRGCALELREHQVDVSQTNKFHQTPLHIALESKWSGPDLQFLHDIEHVDHPDCFGYTPLHWAVINNDSELCAQLIARGANVLAPLQIQQGGHMDRRFASANIGLCGRENAFSISLKLHRALMEPLVPQINAQVCGTLTEDGNSLLHLSARLIVPAATTVLLERGSGVNVANGNGNTPILALLLESMENCFEMEGFFEVLQALVGGGADVSLLNHEGLSAFDCALRTNSRKTLNWVLSECRALTARPEDVLTLYQRQWPDSLKTVLGLQSAAFLSQLLKSYVQDEQQELFEFVLDQASHEFRQSVLQELLLLCAVSRRRSLFDFLLRYPLQEPQILSNGETLLTAAIRNCDEDYCLELVKWESRELLVDVKNKKQETALHVAAQRGFVKLFKRLVIVCQKVKEESNGLTAIQVLMGTVCRLKDKKKMDKLETIFQMMVKLGLKQTLIASLISQCSDCALKEKLDKFYKNALAAGTLAEDDESTNLCDICLYNKKNCVMTCGHPMCLECAAKVPMCPTCRKPKTNLIPLFL